MRHLFLDFETRAKLVLKTVGLDVYSANCEILMVAWAYDDGPVTVVTCDEGIPEHLLADLTCAGVMKLAWNAQFERAVIRVQLDIDSPVEQWTDPMVLARYAGLPGKLALASRYLNPKDKAKSREGPRLIQKFSKSHRSKKLGVHFKDWKDPKHAGDWERFQYYCRQDVIAERGIYNRLKAVFTPPAFERKLWELDQKINQRGMPVSVDYISSSEKAVLCERERLEAALIGLTGLENVNSVGRLLVWLKERGYPYSDLSREHVAKALEGSNDAGGERSPEDPSDTLEVERQEA